MAEELEEGLDLSTEQEVGPDVNASTNNEAEIHEEGVTEGRHWFAKKI